MRHNPNYQDRNDIVQNLEYRISKKVYAATNHSYYYNKYQRATALEYFGHCSINLGNGRCQFGQVVPYNNLLRIILLRHHRNRHG